MNGELKFELDEYEELLEKNKRLISLEVKLDTAVHLEGCTDDYSMLKVKNQELFEKCEF